MTVTEKNYLTLILITQLDKRNIYFIFKNPLAVTNHTLIQLLTN